MVFVFEKVFFSNDLVDVFHGLSIIVRIRWLIVLKTLVQYGYEWINWYKGTIEFKTDYSFYMYLDEEEVE